MTALIADLQINSASQQFVKVPLASDTGSDPTTSVVSMAFPKTGSEPTTFYSGTWQTISGIYYARVLVGPSTAIQLAVGFYDVYVKLVATFETPVLYAGQLEVT